ncbi:polysaccharide biosynthesis/export family protein [uncultured Roseobacter sp.]|uniref:polysaccharide biosynthesis/export family protein n=1 Tax=uncultured Roseobacter sp. TaxID=114847 RepID=UPI0026276D63|nr:polysaccharide biosynthesis/export family protein [uncultured Roseobacter sp.]
MAQLLKTFLTGLVLALWTGLAAAQGEYRVQTGDTLTIEVLEDNSLNRTVVVLPDGRFSFPFAGPLPARGQTVGEIQAGITNAIAPNFATRPTVFVSVNPAVRIPEAVTSGLTGPTISIYFVGEVNRPGVVEVEAGTTLLQAVAISGGVSRFAAVKRIQLRRTDARTRQQSVTTLNYKALADGAVTTDIELKDGDVILVPERRLFE